MGWLASTTFVICSSGYTWRNRTNIYVNLLSPSPTLSLHHFVLLLKYLLAVLQDALLGADAALGARGVRLPLAALHVDVHVEFAAKHGHLGLRQQTHGNVCRHLRVEEKAGLMRYTTRVKNSLSPCAEKKTKNCKTDAIKFYCLDREGRGEEISAFDEK